MFYKETFNFLPADPLSVWERIHPHPRYGFFLGSGSSSVVDHTVAMSASEPQAVFRMPGESAQRAYHAFRREVNQRAFKLDIPRFVGLIHFEAGRAFDPGIRRLPKRPQPLGTPWILMGDYPSIVTLDLLKGKTTIFSLHANEFNRVREILFAFRTMRARTGMKKKNSHFSIHKSKFHSPSFNRFSKMVHSAKRAIRAGDIYQANLSIRFEGAFSSSPISLYRRLCSLNPSPYACLLKAPGSWVASCSPELLLEVRGREVITRPIAGTRPRGTSKREDQVRRGQLLLSPKERAEHIMLVDLERNDLGRVCRPGSVRVSDRFLVERYSHVMHIVSEVRGRLKPKKSAVDAVEALFPGGTITGCPKISAIEMIENVEGRSRGPFYGSAGYFSWNGNAKFNILIRSAFIRKQRLAIQAGAGIVADSHPKREYKEVLAKAQALLEAAWKVNSDL